MKFWWTIDKQKYRIMNKILKRANMCLYSIHNGKHYITAICNDSHRTYEPCSGKQNSLHIRVGVYVYQYDDHDLDFPIAYIDRHGKIKSNRYKVLETKDGKKYLK